MDKTDPEVSYLRGDAMLLVSKALLPKRPLHQDWRSFVERQGFAREISHKGVSKKRQSCLSFLNPPHLPTFRVLAQCLVQVR